MICEIHPINIDVDFVKSVVQTLRMTSKKILRDCSAKECTLNNLSVK